MSPKAAPDYAGIAAAARRIAQVEHDARTALGERMTTPSPSITRTVTRTIELDGEQVKVEARYGIVTPQIGRSYFSVTGSAWYPTPAGRYRNEPDAGGQIADEVLAAFPWLALLVGLHLHDAVTGEPMHAVENGWFWYSAEKHSRRGDKVCFPTGWAQLTGAQRAGAYLGCEPTLFEGVTTKAEFSAVVDTLRPAWREVARVATSLYNLGGEVSDRSSCPEWLAEQAAVAADRLVNIPTHLLGPAGRALQASVNSGTQK